MTTPTVLIVDDHPLFRDALDSALQTTFPGGTTSLMAGSIDGAQAVLDEHEVDLILLDLNLGEASSFDGLVTLKARQSAPPIFVVSATESDEVYGQARQLGASGYLPKSLPLDDLCAVLVTAMDGGTWFPQSRAGSSGEGDDATSRLASLTPAQNRVLSHLSDGLLNKQIAFEMGISEATVKAHLTAIFRKLGANNRTQALLAYKSALSV